MSPISQRGHYRITGLNDIGIGPWGFVAHDGRVTWIHPGRFIYQDDKSGLRSEVSVRIEPAKANNAESIDSVSDRSIPYHGANP
jgi:hypothetical protein